MGGVYISLRCADFHRAGIIKNYKPGGRHNIYGLRIGDPAGEGVISRCSGDVVPSHIHLAVQRRAFVFRLLIVRDRRHFCSGGLGHFSVLNITDHGVWRHYFAPVVHSLNDRHFRSVRNFGDNFTLYTAGRPEFRRPGHFCLLALSPRAADTHAVGLRKDFIRKVSEPADKIQRDVKGIPFFHTDRVLLLCLRA